jgi:alpha/beta superfamily hydrolase
MEIRAGVELPARRENIELHTSDGLTLVGELSLPLEAAPVATLVTLHPLPTAGGFMDSHIIRKAAARLPALAGLAVLRFNLRGVSSPRGTSQGSFDEGDGEQYDLAAAMALVEERSLPHPWLMGWSFGTEIVLKYGQRHPIDGAILLSPPLLPRQSTARSRARRAWLPCANFRTTPWRGRSPRLPHSAASRAGDWIWACLQLMRRLSAASTSPCSGWLPTRHRG